MERLVIQNLMSKWKYFMAFSRANVSLKTGP
jgi:hypothetical protein